MSENNKVPCSTCGKSIDEGTAIYIGQEGDKPRPYCWSCNELDEQPLANEQLEHYMRVLWDIKKEIVYSKFEGVWYCHDKGEPLFEYHFKTFLEALKDAVEPYVTDSE